MKKIEFNNFRYSFINSSLHGYKEILVTFTANGKNMHQAIFLEETKGTLNGTYIKEAKEEIARQIKTGELLKKSKRSIKANVKKPLMVALTAAVAAGAITGTYFLTRYYMTRNNFNVVLLPGEGSFAIGAKPYLLFENVKSGTKLNKIDGYMIPATIDNKDFGYWINSDGTQYEESDLITQDLYLTASFYEGINYNRNKAMRELFERQEEFTEFVKDSEINPDIVPNYKQIVQIANNTLENDELVNEIELTKTIEEFANTSMDVILTYDDSDSFLNIVKIFSDCMSTSISDSLTSLQSTALLKLHNSYLRNFADYPNCNAVLKGHDALENFVKNVLVSPDDDKMIGAAYYVAPAIMNSCANMDEDYFNTLQFSQLLYSCTETFSNLPENLTEEETQDAADLIADYITSTNKALTETDLNNCKNYFDSAMLAFNSAIGKDENSKEKIVAKLMQQGMKAFSKINNGYYKDDSIEIEYPDFALATELIDRVIKTFSNVYEEVAADPTLLAHYSKIALDACFAVKSVKSGEGRDIFLKIFEGAMDTKENKYLPSFAEKAMEALTHLPSVKIQSSGDEKDNLASTPAYIFQILDEAQNGYVGTIPEAQKYFEILYKGIIESAGYSKFYSRTMTEGVFVNLKNCMEGTINLMRTEPLNDSLLLLTNVIAGLFAGISQAESVLVQNGREFISITSSMYDFNYLYGEFISYFPSDIKNDSFVCDSMQKIIANSCKNYWSVLYLEGKSAEFIKLVSWSVEMMNDFNDGQFQSNVNLVTMWSKYTSASYIFNRCNDFEEYTKKFDQFAKKSSDIVLDLIDSQKLNFLINSNYKSPKKFPKKFEMFNNNFYSKLTYNIDFRVVKVFAQITESNL